MHPSIAVVARTKGVGSAGTVQGALTVERLQTEFGRARAVAEDDDFNTSYEEEKQKQKEPFKDVVEEEDRRKEEEEEEEEGKGVGL